MTQARIIIGVDESGMGSLAGPLVVAATAFHKDDGPFQVPYLTPDKDKILSLKDSKKIKKPEHRECLDRGIKCKARAHSVVTRSAAEIDDALIHRIRIECLRLCVARVMEKLHGEFPLISDYVVWLDGDILCPQYIPCKVESIPLGDATYWQISAASILAKVAYDSEIKRIAEKYPEYCFERHKGYPTKEHKRLLAELGPCPEHRRTFKTVYNHGPITEGAEEL